MSDKLRDLAKRRERLVEAAASQRQLLGQCIEPWRTPLLLVDRGLAAVHCIKRHPAWLAGVGLGLLTVVRPSRIGKWLQRGWLVWQVLQTIRKK